MLQKGDIAEDGVSGPNDSASDVSDDAWSTRCVMVGSRKQERESVESSVTSSTWWAFRFHDTRQSVLDRRTRVPFVEASPPDRVSALSDVLQVDERFVCEAAYPSARYNLLCVVD